MTVCRNYFFKFICIIKLNIIKRCLIKNIKIINFDIMLTVVKIIDIVSTLIIS